VLDPGSRSGRWFPGGRLNTCWNAVDRHVVAGRGDQPAVIHDSPVTSTKTTLTYRELQDRVARFAGVLRGLGVAVGDRVVIYMPMVPEALVAMLACARLGAVHSVVFGGFAARELAIRIDDARPKAVVCGSCGVEPTRVVPYKPLLDAALGMARHAPERVVVLQRAIQPAELHPGRDLDWDEAMAAASPVECVPVAATDPLYVLYTSGTTGTPKGVVRDHGGHAVALHWTMGNVYGVQPGETFWAASDVGWVVGHSYIVYGPLLRGATTVVYEGKPVGTPDPGAFWRVMSEHGVVAMFTAPTAMRAIKKEDPEGELLAGYELSRLRAQFLAGERCDPDTFLWVRDRLRVPVIDHWWQTETGWPITGIPLGVSPDLPPKAGSAGVRMPGWDLQVLDADHAPVPPGTIGSLVVKLPLPPGALTTLWGNEERFVAGYLRDVPGFYKTGDAGFIDPEGYVHVMSRTDDLINVAGHRLSTGQMEQVLASHPAVAECAVIGVADDLKGQVPLGLFVLKRGVAEPPAEIARALVQRVRDEIGPVAAFKIAVPVERLPKTRSGKILRGTMRQIADGERWSTPATVDDPSALGVVEEALASAGYPRHP